jgi:hypothetical protein
VSDQRNQAKIPNVWGFEGMCGTDKARAISNLRYLELAQQIFGGFSAWI